MRRMVWFVVISAIFGGVAIAQAQQPGKVPRIGYLAALSLSSVPARTEAFRQGLRELGYVEGKNIVIEWRSSEGKADQLPGLLAELVRLKVDIIIASAPVVTRSAKEATKTIPIVMTNEGDPIGTGIVASLARPGGNITGLSTLSPEISGKQLELLKEIVPRPARLALIGTSTLPIHAQMLRETELAAQAFGVKLQYLDVLDPKDIEAHSDPQAGGALMPSWCGGSCAQFSPNTDHRPCGKESAPGNAQRRSNRGRRGTHDL